jgi:acyl-[acyl-carrier-protein]-phospholipid O-acyltransferase/long-chain-fatty-acid--[acyl-carrier-protein] ligase
VLPFFHTFGCTATLWFPLVQGLTAVYHPNPMDGRAVGRLVQRYRIDLLLATPTFCRAYERSCSPEQLSSLRYVLVGAERLPETTARLFRERFGKELLEGYGCTEMAPVVSVNVPDLASGAGLQRGHRPGTVGQPLPGVSVRVVDRESGAPLPPGCEGLLLVRGPNRMLGYWKRPEETAQALCQGWYLTGDVGAVDEDGFVRITDRASRFSKVAGEMVPHGRIEEAVGRLIGGAPCAVISLPEARKGERLVVVYARQEISPERLREDLARAGLPRLWLPRRESLFPVASIPTLASGKADLRKIRALALALTADSAA